MKKKKDYQITIGADEDETCFYDVTVNGERKQLELDDYITVVNMLNAVKGSVIKSIKNIYLSDEIQQPK